MFAADLIFDSIARFCRGVVAVVAMPILLEFEQRLETSLGEK